MLQNLVLQPSVHFPHSSDETLTLGVLVSVALAVASSVDALTMVEPLVAFVLVALAAVAVAASCADLASDFAFVHVAAASNSGLVLCPDLAACSCY